jgi:hypothetical protein
MSFSMAIMMLFVGCCLIWVAVHGTEATTPWGVFQEITKGLSGQGAAEREESATVGADPTAARAAAGRTAVQSKKSATILGGTVSTRVVSPKAPRAPRAPRSDPKYGIKIDGTGGGTPKSGGGGRSSLSKATDSLGGNHRRILVAEFLVCVTILAFSPMTAKHSGDTPVAFMKRGASICALFFILGLVSAGGKGASKVAAGFGGIVTLALLMSSRDVFAVLAGKFTGSGPADDPNAASVDGNVDVTPGPDGQAFSSDPGMFLGPDGTAVG